MNRRDNRMDTEDHKIRLSDLGQPGELLGSPKQQRVSTEIPVRTDPFNQPPSLAGTQGENFAEAPEAANHPNEVYRWSSDLDGSSEERLSGATATVAPSTRGDSRHDFTSAETDYADSYYPADSWSDSFSDVPSYAEQVPAAPVHPPVRVQRSHDQDAAASQDHANSEDPARRSLLKPLMIFGGIVVVAITCLVWLSTSLNDSDNNNQLAASGETPTSTAPPSTLATEIVDLNAVADEDTMRLEIPLDPNTTAADVAADVDLSLAPLKVTITNGQVVLTGTAQSEEQAQAMVDQAATVFPGIELVTDYDVNPRAPRPESGVVVQKPVVFEPGSTEIRPEYYAVLDACADVLASQPSLVMTVAGHTDNVGSSALNLQLAEQRAQAVIDYYTARGLDANSFERVALGENSPISSNDSERGREDNRRTDLEFEGIFDDVVGATQDQ